MRNSKLEARTSRPHVLLSARLLFGADLLNTFVVNGQIMRTKKLSAGNHARIDSLPLHKQREGVLK